MMSYKRYLRCYTGHSTTCDDSVFWRQSDEKIKIAFSVTK